MDFILRLFRRKRTLFPRWFYESVRGNLLVRIGQDFSATGEPEVVIRFEMRVNYGKWKPLGTFRYLDVPNMRLLLLEVDKHMRYLLTQQ